MNEIPGHISPTYSDASREDALFHYATADGLIGIFNEGRIWNTAYYCANDESELTEGKGIIRSAIWSATQNLIEARDPRVEVFSRRGVDIRQYADNFEQQIASMALNLLCAYITCFCRPSGEEDFKHGLLSQWRGYGIDGGYALQFSRKKILGVIDKSFEANSFNHELQDVHYSTENPLKEAVLSHAESFVRAYDEHLTELAKPIDFNQKTMRSPLSGLPGGPLESLLDCLVNTKNKHFSEERECRLSLIQLVDSCDGCLPVEHFNRGGLVVPYVKTPLELDILSCIEWILVGPGPRMGARFKSMGQLIRRSGLDIKVRPSHIPFTRL
jgi:hypothetical protein